MSSRENSNHNVAAAIQRNQATVHSMVDKEDSGVKKGTLVTEDMSASKMGFHNLVLYLAAGPGTTMTLMIFGYFFLVHCVRLISNFWLSFWIPDKLGFGTNHGRDSIYLGFLQCLLCHLHHWCTHPQLGICIHNIQEGPHSP
ncbi:hypothetical protein DSO57_1002888 [Entomophthora muscae]|uniref:Uncharacterized protein n=1 Tax=Entomophthora muscae TaxID=34485 RepID=A0ACC2SL82_9FUNG|nr:hypothetical protein DSO57_1002888 [Entomophthora muscae]